MTPPADAVEPDLIRAVVAGEARAIDAWFRAEHPLVFRLCFGFLGGEAQADDAAQDAMLKLLDHLASYDPARPYGRWRNTVVLNLCRDRLRRAASRRAAERAAAGELLPARLPAPDDAAQAGELRAALAASLAALSPREREAFVLRDLHGASTADVARSMGVTPSSLRSLLTLARRRLRGLLAGRLPELAAGEGGARA